MRPPARCDGDRQPPTEASHPLAGPRVQRKEARDWSQVSPRLQAVVLFACAVLLYANTLAFQYALDDVAVIAGNRFTRAGWSGIADILSHDGLVGVGANSDSLPGGRFRALSQVTFAVEWALFGRNPFVGHLVNVVLYGLTVLLLFLLLRRFCPPSADEEGFLSLPFIATALFLVHPLHTEVVANIKGREDILVFLGSAAALLFTVSYVDTRKASRLILSAAMFLLALLAKENAVAFLAVIPLTLYVFTAARLKDYATSSAALAAGLTVYLAAFRVPALGYLTNLRVSGSGLLINPFLDATTGQKYATVLYTWLVYLKLLIFPHPLTWDYYTKQIPLIGWGDSRALLPLALYGSAALFALWRIRARSRAAYCILFFFLTFILQSNLLVPLNYFLAERIMFIPSAAWCALAAGAATRVLSLASHRGRGFRAAAIGLVGAVLAAYALKTYTRNFAWKDSFTILATDVETSSNSVMSNMQGGGALMTKALGLNDPAARTAMLDKAITLLNKAVEIYPQHPSPKLLLGEAYRHRKAYALSLAAYGSVVGLMSERDKALAGLRQLGQQCVEDQAWESAVKVYLTLLNHQPDDQQVITRLAQSYANLGRTDRSVALLQRLIAANPADYRAYHTLGLLYAKHLNDLDAAIVFLTKAYEIEKGDPALLDDLGVASANRRDYARATEFFAAAAALRPGDQELSTKLANARLLKARQDRR